MYILSCLGDATVALLISKKGKNKLSKHDVPSILKHQFHGCKMLGEQCIRLCMFWLQNLSGSACLVIPVSRICH